VSRTSDFHFDDKKVVQVFALGGQQRGKNGARPRDFGDIVRDQILQEIPAFFPRDGEKATGFKKDGAKIGHTGSRWIARRCQRVTPLHLSAAGGIDKRRRPRRARLGKRRSCGV
jgi:hypothetical protein